MIFFHVLGTIIPFDFHIFQRGRSTNQLCLTTFYDKAYVKPPTSYCSNILSVGIFYVNFIYYILYILC